ncbi:MAG: hypothetical protein IPN19_06065 [Elusimicrobia bacterium]|nr:hypothetical protein [Elusimicrobiota bacterium]
MVTRTFNYCPSYLGHVGYNFDGSTAFRFFAVRGQEIVRLCSARSYFSQVAQRGTGNPKRSITVCLYLMSLRSTNSNQDVFELAQSLVRAQASGVRVDVYLDNNASEDDPSFAGFNAPAVAFLQAQGIAVYQDDRSRLAHGKMIIIDEKTILAGSSNWTDAALNKNSETNFLFRSTGAARLAL